LKHLHWLKRRSRCVVIRSQKYITVTSDTPSMLTVATLLSNH